ncbi:hypothetical protein [Streptomyces sp. NBC_01198]|nr:hypothetical protein OG702_00405 [Streptomyces sp. NBC_01198]
MSGSARPIWSAVERDAGAADLGRITQVVRRKPRMPQCRPAVSDAAS